MKKPNKSVVFKFAVYDDPSSEHKHTTYRVRQTENGFVIERYTNYKVGWQIISHTYKSIEMLLDGISFQSLFYRAQKK